MLNHTKKIKEIYEVIQKMIFYMIPEKWDKLYLYSSVIDMPEGKKTGELYFYYIPKGILRKKPVNVYEIPSKFNIDEEEYLKLVKALYQKIQQLREEFRKSETGSIWSNITITIENLKFKVEYNYEDLMEYFENKVVCGFNTTDNQENQDDFSKSSSSSPNSKAIFLALFIDSLYEIFFARSPKAILSIT